jgi:predicted nuclease of predicted toxin-antitoxin system
VVKFLLDADLPKALATALRRRPLALDILRVHEVGLGESSDEEILEFAAGHEQITVTRDKATMRPELALPRRRTSQLLA